MVDTFKRYIGDGVYVKTDGYSIILTAEGVFESPSVIYLEPGHLRAIMFWYEGVLKDEL